mmetsp:Transcript_21681/g.67614  ORF Transcript_21681/g.67614 Transcript_21681/m.67614 type:complete len:204 (-) Transcript_21681:345-956(-)
MHAPQLLHSLQGLQAPRLEPRLLLLQALRTRHGVRQCLDVHQELLHVLSTPELQSLRPSPEALVLQPEAADLLRLLPQRLQLRAQGRQILPMSVHSLKLLGQGLHLALQLGVLRGLLLLALLQLQEEAALVVLREHRDRRLQRGDGLQQVLFLRIELRELLFTQRSGLVECGGVFRQLLLRACDLCLQAGAGGSEILNLGREV